MTIKKTLAQHLRDEMLARCETEVWAGDPDLCIQAYLRSGGIVRHPLNKIRSIINAARQSHLYEKSGFIRSYDISGRRQVLHPVFRLKDK